ncbi:MFS transporter [Castellaniella hirudinis]|uniref:MFS transporter n=1 Tax=Castellaniella hirudinis TaxID=1144617 RepID=UPI0039C27D1B
MKERLPFETYIYFLAQSVNLTAAVMSVTMAALVGEVLAPEPWMSTVPYGFQFLSVMLATYPAARLMTIIGRKKSFLWATVPLAGSGVAGYLAVEMRVFLLLVVAHVLLGVYIAFANFNRFAATDNVAASLKPRAISLVVAGGVLAAITGPLLTAGLKDFGALPAFAACYAAFVGLALVSLVLHLSIKAAPVRRRAAQGSAGRGGGWRLALKNKTVALAILVAAAGYGLMNLLMIQSSMFMAGMQVHFSDVSAAIQWHVLAMFAPSFFTGVLVQALGLRVIVFGGIVLLLLSGLINLVTQDYAILVASLVILGLGWNFTYVGGSALLAQGLERMPGSAVQIQGLNDLGVSMMATLGAFAPAFLLSWPGWAGTNILSIGICLALLVFAVWALSPRRDPFPLDPAASPSGGQRN